MLQRVAALASLMTACAPHACFSSYLDSEHSSYHAIFRFAKGPHDYSQLSHAANQLSFDQLDTVCACAHTLFLADMNGQDICNILKAFKRVSSDTIKDLALNLPHTYTTGMSYQDYLSIAQAVEAMPAENRTENLKLIYNFPRVYP